MISRQSYGRRIPTTEVETCGSALASNRSPGEKRLAFGSWTLVNPLDLSQNLSTDRAFEEFDRVRIPQWFLRADYTIPNESIQDLTAEFILNPGMVVPTILPPQGSPLTSCRHRLRFGTKCDKESDGRRPITGTVDPVHYLLTSLPSPMTTRWSVRHSSPALSSE